MGTEKFYLKKLNLIKSSIFLFLILNSFSLIACDISKIQFFLDQNITFQVTYEQNFNDSSDLITGNIYRDYAKIKVSSSVPKEELIINKNKIFRHDLEMDQLIIEETGESTNQSPAFLLFNKPNLICDFFSKANCSDRTCSFSDPFDNFYLKNIIFFHLILLGNHIHKKPLYLSIDYCCILLDSSSLETPKMGLF